MKEVILTIRASAYVPSSWTEKDAEQFANEYLDQVEELDQVDNLWTTNIEIVEV